MLIFSSGLGILMIPIAFIVITFVFWFLEESPAVNISDASLIPLYISLAILSLIFYIMGKDLNSEKPTHSLFFIKIEYWGIIIFVLNLILVISDAIDSDGIAF